MTLPFDWDGDPTNGGTRPGNTGLQGTTGNERGNILQLLGEGPIQGLSDGLKSVFLDGTPIQGADGSFNTSSVAVGMTAGTLTQGVIAGIRGTESEVSVNTRVSIASGPITRTISTAGLSAVRIRIKYPQLRSISVSTGATTKTSVTVKIERQSASWNGGAWEVVGNLVNTDNTSATVNKAWRIGLPAAGPWSIRLTRITADSSTDYLQNQTWWDAYTEITDAKLACPYSAMLAVSVDAQVFSAIPEITAKIKGRIIKVPANYNPTTRVYATTGTGTTGGVWDGTFTTLWTDNPAWIFYDLCTNTRYGAGNYLNVSGLDKWKLYDIAKWCDVLVDDGKGTSTTEPRFRCNLYIQSQEEAIKILSQLASVFWGICYYAGGIVTARADVDVTPAALFTNANVENGEFEYSGTAYKARHTAVLVTWMDPNLGYASAVEYVEDAAGIARYGYNPVTVTAVGCTSKGQARRYGKWVLLTELMQTETISFTSPMEGAACAPGDIFQVHDRNRAGKSRWGGRIISATSTTVTLDAPVTLASGKTYYLKVRQPDGTLESRTVTTGAGTVSTLTVSVVWTLTPTAMSVWVLQEGSVPTLYRAISITESDPGRYAVTALSHDPTKYALIESGLVAVNTPGPSVAVPAVVSLAVVESVQTLTDRVSHILTATWTPATGSTPTGYGASISREYGSWTEIPVSGLSAVATNLEPGSYRVRVWALYGSSVSPFSEVSATVTDFGVGSTLASITADDVLSRAEKPVVITNYQGESATHTALVAQASALGVSYSAYDAAWTGLANWLVALSPTWNDVSQDTPLGSGGGATMRSLWSTLSTTGASLDSAIKAKIAANALPVAGTAANSLLLAGLAPSTAATTNTIAQRDASGGLTASSGTFGGANLVGSSTEGLRITPKSGASTYFQAFVDPSGAYYTLTCSAGVASGGQTWDFRGNAITAGAGSFSGNVSTVGYFIANNTNCGMKLQTGAIERARVWVSGGHFYISAFDTSGTYIDDWLYAPGVAGGTVVIGRPISVGGSVHTSGTAFYTDQQNYFGNGSWLVSGYGDTWAAVRGNYGVVFGSGATAIGDISITGMHFNSQNPGSGGIGWSWAIGRRTATNTVTPLSSWDMPGIIRISDASYHSDIPSAGGGGYGNMLNLAGGSDTMSQIYCNYDAPRMFLRTASYAGGAWQWRPGSQANGWVEVYTTQNIDTAPASVQAIKALVNAPQVGTLASRPAASSYPGGYYYATDATAPDGLLGALYHSDGSTWGAALNPVTIAGRVIVGSISAGSAGVTSMAAQMVMSGTIQSLPFTAGTSTGAPSGFKWAGTPYTATCYNGDPTGGSVTTPTVQGELGTGMSFGGYDLSTLVIAKLVNGGVKIYSTPGTYSWRCPAGITQVEVTLIGAGGGGSSNNGGSGGGGGGAGYVKYMATVSPGTAYTVVVGAGAVDFGGTASTFNGADGLATASGGGAAGIGLGGIGGGASCSYGSIAGQTNGNGSMITGVPGALIISIGGGASGAASGQTNGITPFNTGTGNVQNAGGCSGSSTYGKGGSGSSSGAGQAGASGFAMLRW